MGPGCSLCSGPAAGPPGSVPVWWFRTGVWLCPLEWTWGGGPSETPQVPQGLQLPQEREGPHLATAQSRPRPELHMSRFVRDPAGRGHPEEHRSARGAPGFPDRPGAAWPCSLLTCRGFRCRVLFPTGRLRPPSCGQWEWSSVPPRVGGSSVPHPGTQEWMPNASNRRGLSCWVSWGISFMHPHPLTRAPEDPSSGCSGLGTPQNTTWGSHVDLHPQATPIAWPALASVSWAVHSSGM